MSYKAPVKLEMYSLGVDNESMVALYEESTFCICCGSDVGTSKTGKKRVLSPGWGIKLILNNITKPGTFTRKLKQQDGWQEEWNIPAVRITEVSQISTRNGPITVAIRTQ